MHLSPAATEDAIRLLDGRQVGVGVAQNFADILETREAELSNQVRLGANALRRDNFRMIMGARKLERATGIETD